MRTINIDLSKEMGKIKPLHGVNNGPITSRGAHFGIDHTEDFKKAGIPYSRLHDTEGSYGGCRYVDIPNIFPDFDKDPKDPASYDFELTDDYIRDIYNAGTQVFYRLGITIEHDRTKRRAHVPKDFQKWSEICEGIIRHYNEGWADGYHYNIEYWEIWNEPHNPLVPNPMWDGTAEDYFRLYEVSANHLKKCFPNIKIGPNIGAVALATRYTKSSDNSWIIPFFEYITSEEHKAPVDFFDDHIYTLDPEEIGAIGTFLRRTLDSYGFTSAEIVIGEYNFGAETNFVKSHKAAAALSAALSIMHRCHVDKAMYYDAQPSLMSYCGLFSYPHFGVEKPFYTMCAFNEVYKLQNEVFSSSDEGNVYTLASKSNNEAAILITRYDIEDLNFHPTYRLDETGYPIKTKEKPPIEWLERADRIPLPLNMYLNIDGIPDGYDAEISYYMIDEKNDLTFIKKDIYEKRTVIKLNSQNVMLIKVKLKKNPETIDKEAKSAAGFME